MRVDGVTDDTAALNRCALAADNANNGEIILPAGTILLGPNGAASANALVRMGDGCALMGQGVKATIIKIKDGANRSAIEIPETSQGCRFADFKIDANKAGQAGTSHGLWFSGSGGYADGQHEVKRLFIQNPLTDGIRTDPQHSFLQMVNVIIRGSGVKGVNLNSADNYLFGVVINDAGDDAFYLTGGFNRLIGCTAYNSGVFGFRIGATATEVILAECDADRSQQNNIEILANNVSVMNSISRDPGQAADVTYSHVRVAPGLSGIRVIGNLFKAKSQANQAVYGIRSDGVLSQSALGPNSYEALSFATDTVLQFGAPGSNFDWGRPRRQVTLVYSANIATNLSLGDYFNIVVTNATAFTIQTPTNLPFDTKRVTYDIYNNSGGAMGAITWGAGFRLAGAFVNPATGQHRLISFEVVGNGTVLREVNRSAADQPN